MGIRSKLVGLDRRDELTAAAIAQARSHAARGLREFTITVHSTYSGLAPLPRLTPHVADQLQQAGFQVVGVQTDGWAYDSRFACRVTEGMREALARDAAAPPAPASGPVAAGPSVVTIDDPAALNDWLTRALAPWSAPTCSGQTFGPGYGHESAIAVMAGVRTPEPYLQAVATRTADLVIDPIRAKRLSFDAYDAALGVDTHSLRRNRVPKRQWDSLFSSVDASKDVLASLATGNMDKLRPWFASDATRRKFYAYHAVAAGRLRLLPP